MRCDRKSMQQHFFIFLACLCSVCTCCDYATSSKLIGCKICDIFFGFLSYSFWKNLCIFFCEDEFRKTQFDEPNRFYSEKLFGEFFDFCSKNFGDIYIHLVFFFKKRILQFDKSNDFIWDNFLFLHMLHLM